MHRGPAPARVDTHPLLQGVKLVRSTDARAAVKNIDCTTQKEIVSAKTWRHPGDGSTVEPEDVTHRGLDLVNPSKFSGVPRAFVVPSSRAAQLRGGPDLKGPLPSITLHKFVPRAALTLYHQVQRLQIPASPDNRVTSQLLSSSSAGRPKAHSTASVCTFDHVSRVYFCECAVQSCMS